MAQADDFHLQDLGWLNNPEGDVDWRHSNDYCNNSPVLFAGDPGAGHAVQRNLGNCWVISAISLLASDWQHVERLFGELREADGLVRDGGPFVFSFHGFGERRVVDVNDLLPCCEVQGAPPWERVFARGVHPDELWVSLLEKAYAKHYGCYRHLDGGCITDALVDFTGGVPCSINLWTQEDKDAARATLFGELRELLGSGEYLLGCSAAEINGGDGNIVDVIPRHAYSIVAVEERDGERVVQIRNPHGGDGGGRLALAFPRFVETFTRVSGVRLLPGRYVTFAAEGEWKEGVGGTVGTAGGRFRPGGLFWDNPVYLLTVTSRCEATIVLHQEDWRGEGLKPDEMGFHVIPATLPPRTFEPLRPPGVDAAEARPRCTNARSIDHTCALEPGLYNIIPYLDKPELTRRFRLEAHVEKGVDGSVPVELRSYQDSDRVLLFDRAAMEVPKVLEEGLARVENPLTELELRHKSLFYPRNTTMYDLNVTKATVITLALELSSEDERVNTGLILRGANGNALLRSEISRQVTCSVELEPGQYKVELALPPLLQTWTPTFSYLRVLLQPRDEGNVGLRPSRPSGEPVKRKLCKHLPVQGVARDRPPAQPAPRPAPALALAPTFTLASITLHPGALDQLFSPASLVYTASTMSETVAFVVSLTLPEAEVDLLLNGVVIRPDRESPRFRLSRDAVSRFLIDLCPREGPPVTYEVEVRVSVRVDSGDAVGIGIQTDAWDAKGDPGSLEDGQAGASASLCASPIPILSGGATLESRGHLPKVVARAMPLTVRVVRHQLDDPGVLGLQRKDKVRETGPTPLYIASQNGQKDVVELLLQAGADKDKAEEDGCTSLHIASSQGHKDVVELLLRAGADKDKAMSDGSTPLYIASQNNRKDVVELLLQARADLGSNQIGDAGALALGEALKVNATVTTLYLGNNRIGDAGAQAFAEALKVNTTVTELNLKSNQIGDAGAQAIAEALEVNTAVTELHLDGNQIGDAGAQAIAEALKVNTAVTNLGLDGNKFGFFLRILRLAPQVARNKRFCDSLDRSLIDLALLSSVREDPKSVMVALSRARFKEPFPSVQAVITSATAFLSWSRDPTPIRIILNYVPADARKALEAFLWDPLDRVTNQTLRTLFDSHRDQIPLINLDKLNLTTIPLFLSSPKISHLSLRSNLLDDLPDAFFQHGPIPAKISLEGNPLSAIPRAFRDDPVNIGYMWDRALDQPITMVVARVVLVGSAAAGKSTLVRILHEALHPETIPRQSWFSDSLPPVAIEATVGISVNDLRLISSPDPSRQLDAKVYDLGGDPVYQRAHSLFMYPQAVFVFVLSLVGIVSDEDKKKSKGEVAGAWPAELQKLGGWLRDVRTVVPTATVMIVGTRAKEVNLKPSLGERLVQIQKVFSEHGGQLVLKDRIYGLECATRQLYPLVNPTKPILTPKLVDYLVGACCEALERVGPALWKDVPSSYVHLATAVEGMSRSLPLAMPLASFAEKVGWVDLDKLERALWFLGYQSVVVYEPVLKMVFPDPKRVFKVVYALLWWKHYQQCVRERRQLPVVTLDPVMTTLEADLSANKALIEALELADPKAALYSLGIVTKPVFDLLLGAVLAGVPEVDRASADQDVLTVLETHGVVVRSSPPAGVVADSLYLVVPVLRANEQGCPPAASPGRYPAWASVQLRYKVGRRMPALPPLVTGNLQVAMLERHPSLKIAVDAWGVGLALWRRDNQDVSLEKAVNPWLLAVVAWDDGSDDLLVTLELLAVDALGGLSWVHACVIVALKRFAMDGAAVSISCTDCRKSWDSAEAYTAEYADGGELCLCSGVVDGTPCTAPLPGWAFQKSVDWDKRASPRSPRFAAIEQEERKMVGGGNSGGTRVPKWLSAAPAGLEASKNAVEFFSGSLGAVAPHVPLVGWILDLVRLAVQCKITELEVLENADELEEVLAEVEGDLVDLMTSFDGASDARLTAKLERLYRAVIKAGDVRQLWVDLHQRGLVRWAKRKYTVWTGRMARMFESAKRKLHNAKIDLTIGSPKLLELTYHRTLATSLSTSFRTSPTASSSETSVCLLMPRSALQCQELDDDNSDLSTRDLTPNSKAFTDPTHACHPLVRLVHGELTRLGGPAFKIASLQLTRNSNLAAAFWGRLRVLADQARSKTIEPVRPWPQDSQSANRDAVMSVLAQSHLARLAGIVSTLTGAQVSSDLRFKLDTLSPPSSEVTFDDLVHAGLDLAWHGAQPDVQRNICRTGFLSISTLNDGWHGRGIYLTHYPAYADFYVRVRGGASSPARSLLLSWVLHGKTYPVVGRMDKITFEVELERQEVDGRVYLCHEGKRLFRLTPGDPDVKHIAVPNPDPFTTWSLKADGQTAVGVFTGPEHPHHAGYPGHDSHYALVTEQGLTCTVFDPSPVYAFDEICALNPDNLLPLAVVDVLI